MRLSFMLAGDWGERFFRYLFDFKEQNEFQNDSAQIMQWLVGIVDIKKWIWRLDWWTNRRLKANLCTWKYVIQEVFLWSL